MSPTQRTLKKLKDSGIKCDIVERFIPVRPYGMRKDLFGIIDIIALDPTRGVIGIQSTGSGFSQHLKAMLNEKRQECIDWLRTPGTALELWGWRKVKVKRGGKAMKWEVRIKVFTLDDFKEV